MLSKSKLTAFLATTNPNYAREFYEERLGLTFVRDDGLALVFDSNGTRLRIAKVANFTPVPFTVLGWEVANIERAVEGLAGAGITLERYPFLSQDAHGVCTFENGDQVGWFKDPDGNTLSIAELAGESSAV